MSGGGPLLAACVAVLVAFVTAMVTARTTRRANAVQGDVALSAESRQWVTQAQADAKEAKNDAAAARKESQEALVRADTAEQKLRGASAEFERRQEDLIHQTDLLMRWIGRVVREAHAPALVGHTDPEVRRLLETINGGPPGVTGDRLKINPGH